MNFCLENFDDSEHQFRDMRMLLISSYRYLNKPVNWLLTRLEDWRYGGSALGRVPEDTSATKKAWLWRTPQGELAGFCIKEHEGDSVWIQVHPNHAELTRLALNWLSQAWDPRAHRIETFTDSRDQFRQSILQQLGFQNLGVNGYVWGYDLTQPELEPHLPAGFHFSNLAENPELKNSLMKAINCCFAEDLDIPWLEAKLLAPAMDPARVWMVVSQEQRVVSFCFGWVDSENQVAELEPIGTEPDFRNHGLAKLIIRKAFHELSYRGIHHAFISSGSDPDMTVPLYKSLSPCGCWDTQKWQKSVA